MIEPILERKKDEQKNCTWMQEWQMQPNNFYCVHSRCFARALSPALLSMFHYLCYSSSFLTSVMRNWKINIIVIRMCDKVISRSSGTMIQKNLFVDLQLNQLCETVCAHSLNESQSFPCIASSITIILFRKDLLICNAYFELSLWNRFA